MASTRPARNRVEIDFLPPFGKSEVTVFGPIAKVVGLAAAVAILGRYL